MEDTMTKYIDAGKLKAEIERLRKLVEEDNYYLDNYEQALGYGLALDDMGQFLDTLSEEPDKSLKEAMEGIVHAFGLHNAICIKDPEWADKLDKYKDGDKILVIVLPKEEPNNG